MIMSMPVANVLAPYVAWGVGSDMGLSLPFSIYATVLAGLIEYPLVKRSGWTHRPLLFVLQANLVSWAVGCFLVHYLFFIIIFLAIPFSILIEGGYLYLHSRRLSLPFPWLAIIIGNVLSGLLLLVIKEIGIETGDAWQIIRHPVVVFLQRHKEFNEELLTNIAWTLVIVIVVVAILDWLNMAKHEPISPTVATQTPDADPRS